MVMRLSALGDVAMIVPVVLALQQQYPQLKITVVSRPLHRSFFKTIPGVHFYAVNPEHSKSGVFDLFRLYKELSKLGVTAFADLHDVLRSKVIRTCFKWNGVPVASLNKGRPERKKLTALKPKVLSPITPIVERHAEVCKSLGLPIALNKVKLLSGRNMSDSVLQITGVKKTKWIGIAPFATYETKMYPLDLMEETMQLLLKSKYRIFLFGGGKHEAIQLEKMAAVSESVSNMAGRLSFDQELELISNLDLMLSMDSGNGHMAAMFGIPVVTMWGNTHPYAGFMPFGQPLSHSLLPDLKTYPLLPTSIYGNKVLPGYSDCMKSIRPVTVARKISEVLEG